MSAIRCPNPGCGGTEHYDVRDVYERHRGFRWWRFWLGVAVYRKRVGAGVVCCRCDTPMVHADSESFPTRKAMERMGVTPLRPVGSPEIRMNQKADNVRPITLDA